ncbi:MAG: adenylate/guanylate cyclase domain-containing response regulator [Gammaproteobacteria bacterium]|nr:adenylate/guanylate cyclase domain-containing response regulator [Gammaproteobacteria bacterium]NIR90361.1 adenylate/guanylate cyclase domain-containing response regulator [Gammaproteobacteria bacterium]NIU03313.1 adenylate/guanylate cyclase domain-containing response regulator [Gammaproteobacteria bacterium]NIV50808.1 response regulator [Gammaproteobacteria bacterium]NIW85720.1 response regulator [Gammaproteobacteria bacterium]
MTEGSQILIVDDEPLNVDLLEQELEDLGQEVFTARNGRQALEFIGKHRWDIVLLDIIMPGMNGDEVLEHLHAGGLLVDLPVIVISSSGDLKRVVRCIELGAEDYVTKPFNPTLLKARVRATLEKKRLRDKMAQQLAVTREIFGKYVPDSVAEAILAGQGRLKPIKTTATILYADIEGFTTIVESMAPERVVQMLNEYFRAVVEPIKRHGGIINQFQGDAMLVTFNVPVADPRHADAAVEVAVEIQRLLRTHRFAGELLHARIGVSTGEVVAGNVGADDRLNYTVHGDAVNLAARFEELNKEYGTHVLLSEATVASLEGSYAIQPVGEVPIRGKRAAVTAYKLAV